MGPEVCGGRLGALRRPRAQGNVTAAAGPRSPPRLRGGLSLSERRNPDLDSALASSTGAPRRTELFLLRAGCRDAVRGRVPVKVSGPTSKVRRKGGPEWGAGKAQGMSGLTGFPGARRLIRTNCSLCARPCNQAAVTRGSRARLSLGPESCCPRWPSCSPGWTSPLHHDPSSPGRR